MFLEILGLVFFVYSCRPQALKFGTVVGEVIIPPGHFWSFHERARLACYCQIGQFWGWKPGPASFFTVYVCGGPAFCPRPFKFRTVVVETIAKGVNVWYFWKRAQVVRYFQIMQFWSQNLVTPLFCMGIWGCASLINEPLGSSIPTPTYRLDSASYGLQLCRQKVSLKPPVGRAVSLPNLRFQWFWTPLARHDNWHHTYSYCFTTF